VEEKNETPKTESNAENSNDGKHELDVLNEAKRINEEMKKQNEEKKKLLDREEKLVARKEALNALGGGSPAGAKPIPKVQTAKEYAEDVMAGKYNKK
jgi:hypothetical protein